MKTMNMLSKATLALLLAGAVTFTACKKERSEVKEALIETTVNENEATQAYEDVFDNTMGIGTETGEDLGITGGIGIFSRSTDFDNTVARPDSGRCFTIRVVPQTPGVFPKTVTIDFGTGCIGKDGKLRKGKIITVFTGPMRIPGSKASTTFDGYKVDSVAVAGTHQVENNSTSNNQIFTTRVLDGKLTWDSGRWIKWSSTKTVTQLEGNGTPLYPLDDVFSIVGAGRGENSRGNSWAHEIIEPLIKKFTCRWISKGVVRIRWNDTSALLNYGNGECDNKATINVNGTIREITLPR
jgi:hypothetical protein